MDNQHRKIKGYRELETHEINQMNAIKEEGVLIEELINDVIAKGGDARWASIAKTHLQQGLMALTRAVAKPDFF